MITVPFILSLKTMSAYFVIWNASHVRAHHTIALNVFLINIYSIMIASTIVQEYFLLENAFISVQRAISKTMRNV